MIPQTFPIHDSEYHSIAILPTVDGTLGLKLTLRVHEDEPLDQLVEFGLSQRSCCLVFEKCWRITTNLFGLYTARETIDRWELVPNSDLVRQVKEMGCGASIGFQHHRLLFSGGSTLDVLAEQVSIQ